VALRLLPVDFHGEGNEPPLSLPDTVADRMRAVPPPILRASFIVGSWVFSVPRRGIVTVFPERRMGPVSRKESRDFPSFFRLGNPSFLPFFDLT
jgi:hypothetical protein